MNAPGDRFAPAPLPFAWGSRTYIMGVLNVTPDSFSGDGIYLDPAAALDQAERMVAEGADLIDLGGESTRPGAKPVDLEEELRRVIPVIDRLAPRLTVPISIDTSKSEVARRAIAAGATIVNDVWGLRADPQMPAAAAAAAGVVIMHNQSGTEYADLLGDILRVLRQSIDLATAAGIPRDRLIVDPGIGFGKTPDHNLEILDRLSFLRELGPPILVGTSRKSTIGKVLDLPPGDRVEGTAATVAIAIARGADIVRVHDVKPLARVARMADAIVRRRC
ncbi:MAG TPA: dihydropteroate synthase [Dehalococcoidia bacterium]|nr:dihydropteroate synthase [Dehalococcoidia bacterium]